MAKATKKSSVKITLGKNKRKNDEEAEKIALEALQNMENEESEDDEEYDSEDEVDPDAENNTIADTMFSNSTTAQINERDVFEDAQKAAIARNVPIYFSIYKNTGYIARAEYPYSWDKIQKQFGEGHYKVIAKYHGTNQIVTSQSQFVVGIEKPIEASKENETNQSMSWVALMNEQTEKAKIESQSQAQAQASSMSTMMQMMMQTQAQASSQMQLMMMEMNKQSQAQAQASQALVLSLMTSLASKKDDNGGFNSATVLKMIQDAEARGESKTKSWYDLVEKKAEQIAEDRIEAQGSGEENESTVKTLVKSFVPILSQVMNQNAQAQAQPQMTQAQQAQLVAQKNQEALMNRPNQVIQQGREQSGQGPRPNVGFADERKGIVKTNPIPQASRPEIIVQPQDLVSSNRKEATLETKSKIFNLVKADIGSALLLRKKATETAEKCLKLLEKEGFLRQTVKESLTLEDYFKFAKENSVPDMAKPWIEEFYAEIQKTGVASVSTNGKSTKPTRSIVESRESTQDKTN